MTVPVCISILPVWFKSAFSSVTWALSSLIFIAAIASWVPQVRDSQLGYILNALTEPVVAPVRSVLNRIPALGNLPFDFSPLVAFFLLNLVRDIVISL